MNATCIQTRRGRVVDLATFKEEDIDLDDIVHALSNITRFTGHCRVPYSVAQHSVIVSRSCPDPHKAWGLMHDASEAYLGDVSRPLKSMLPDYQEIEERVMKVIARRFNLPWPMPKEVKVADMAALVSEKNILFDHQIEWTSDIQTDHLPEIHNIWNPAQARVMFYGQARELGVA